MKTLKKVLSILFASALVLAMLAGCGKKNSDKYFLGASGPLTGDAAKYGISVQHGAELAIAEINAAGGLNGKEFYFEIIDDGATAEDAASAYDALYDKGMQVSLGSVTSGSCMAFGAKAEQDKMFFMTPSASQQDIIDDYTVSSRVCFGDPDQGYLAADALTKSYSNIGVIYDNSDSYSSGIYKAFESKMKELGKTYIVKTFDAESNKDFSTQAEALKGCDAIFLPIYYTEAGLIAKALAAKGCNSLVFGCDGFDGIADQLDATVKAPIKYITPFDANSTDPQVAAFVAAYKAKFNTVPDQFAADGYDAVYAIFNAMKAAGIDDTSIAPADLCAKIQATLFSASFSYKGVTGTMTWDKSGACTKVPVIVELQ